MSVRVKVWIAMGTLILWMSAAYFGISHIYLDSQFRQYANASHQQQAKRWADYLASYYSTHHTWAGVKAQIQLYAERQGVQDPNFSLVAMDIKTPSGQPIVHITLPNSTLDSDALQANAGDTERAGDTTVPVRVANQTIALATVFDRDIEGQEALEQEALHSMAAAIIVGLILTAVISLVAAGILSRRLTAPLEVMMAAVRRIGNGDLSTQAVVKSKDEFARLAGALNEMSKELNAAVQTRRHLVADVAHELRTPVTIIQGQLDLLQDGLVPATPASLLPLQDEVLRLRTLIDELHQLALAESHQLVIHRQPLELVHWMQQLVEKFTPDAADKEIQLRLDSEVEQVWVYADSHRLTQVFGNLVSNAIRYTPSGGHIEIGIREERKRAGMSNKSQEHGAPKVVIDVTNTGPGISTDKIEHVFDRFFRTEEARSRESGGMGLGLAIAKELVQLHDGTIAARSEAGIRTTFTVTLPIYRG